MFNIVLLEPEIALNTGNIGRTCSVAGAKLHLIRPLGFRLSEKEIKRAGLDYWEALAPVVYDDYEDFMKMNPEAMSRCFFATTKAVNTYADVNYKPGDFIMFGKESAGIPEEILSANKERCIRIPMAKGKRSLNLSNSAAIILYEALRQNEFVGLEAEGKLHRLEWRSSTKNNLPFRTSP